MYTASCITICTSYGLIETLLHSLTHNHTRWLYFSVVCVYIVLVVSSLIKMIVLLVLLQVILVTSVWGKLARV